MKLRNLFAVAMASAVLFSCSEKEAIVTPEEGTTRIKVVLNANEIGARAGNHYDEGASGDELKIYNYAVFIFNDNGILEASLIAKPYTTGENPTPAGDYTTPLGFVKSETMNTQLNDDNELVLKAGNKLFFAIVNAPADLLRDQEDYVNNDQLNRNSLREMTLDLDGLSKIVGSYDNSGDGGAVKFVNTDTDNRGFMMTTVSNSGFYERTLDESDVAIPIELSVGRVMAKVSLGSKLTGSAGSVSQPNGTLNVESYKIINNPNKTYILSHSDMGIWLSPYYREDATWSASRYFESHSAVNTAIYTSPLENNHIPVSTQNRKSYTYAIENANLTPREGNATIAIIKGTYEPGGDAIIFDNVEDRNPNGVLTDGDFYRIWIEEYNDGIITAGKRFDETNYYYAAKPDQQQLDDYKDAIALAEGWDPTKVSLKVYSYPAGVCYYRLPLKNDKNEVAPYTVKRNSYYMIDVESVQGAGLPGEDTDIDPKEPLEPQTMITVTIKVDEWDKIEQPGNL